MLEVLIVILLLAYLVYSSFASSYKHWERKGIPFIPPKFPAGNVWGAVLMRDSTTDQFTRLYQESGNNAACGIFMFKRPLLMIKDPELIRSVLVKDFNSFVDRGIDMDVDHDKLANHLFFITGDKWKNLRSKMTPAFTSGKMKNMFPIMVDCAKKLEKILVEPARKDEAVEIRDIMARYSTDIIATCAFGLDENSLENPSSQFRECGRRTFSPNFRTFLSQGLAFTSPALRRFLRLTFLPPDLEKYFTSVVEQTVNYRERNEYKRNDLLQLMIQLKNKGYIEDDNLSNGNDQKQGKLTMDELVAQTFLFFTAGFETSSTTASYCMYELSQHEEIQDKVRQEIDAALEKTGGEITYDAVMSMKYLDMVVHETLRKYPPLPMLNREVVKDYYLQEYNCVLEKGTPIVISVIGLHRDPEYYPDPEKFDPERFNDDNKRSRHQYVYLPFGEGPRNCIGSRFGLMQVKAGLISLLHNYSFQLKDEESKNITTDPHLIVMTPIGGINLKLKRIR